MKTSLLLLSILIWLAPLKAQNVSPSLRKDVEDIGRILENYSRKPLWQQKYEGNLVTGNYWMKQGEYAKAIRNFNIALSIVPNSQDALAGRNYCRSMLPKKTQVKKKCNLQR